MTRRLSKQIDCSRSTIPGTDGKIARLGTGALGAVQHGATGYGRTSIIRLLAAEPIIAMARASGLTLEQCERALAAFGRVTQDFLLSGKMVGIPHVGLLAVQKRRRVLSTIHLGKAIARTHPTASTSLLQLHNAHVYRNVVVFMASPMLGRFYDDYGIPAGPLAEYMARERPRLQAVLRDLSGGRPPRRREIKGSKQAHEAKDNTMSTNREPPVQPAKPRPGLLVEDRNAAVRTAQDGAQTIVKVPSRPAEAERQGVSESKI